MKEKNKKQSIVVIIKALIQILLITIAGFGFMILISPASKALQVFMVSFMILLVIIVLIAIYINYAANIYKQIRRG